MNGRMTKTGLFLMELLLVILFFSIASVVCLRMFATAGLRGRSAVSLSEAVVVAQSAAESFRAANANPQQTAALLDGNYDGINVVQFFDATWHPSRSVCAEGYELVLTAQGNAAEICVSDAADQLIYTLDIRVPGGDRS